MTKVPVIFAMALLSCTVWVGCNSKLYRYGSENKVYHGQLSNGAYDSLRRMLSLYSPGVVKDTIMIKYDYNDKSCWYILDTYKDSTIRNLIAAHDRNLRIRMAARPDVSAFAFREPGNHLNKLKKWDNSIIIDSSKQLYQLLFKERTTCGSSIVVLPDKKFVFMRSDSHSEIFGLTREQIGRFLIK